MSGIGAAMTEVMARLGARLPLAPARLADQELLGAIELVEELSRHVDALQLELAHELDVRSEGGPEVDEVSLAHQLGQRGPAQALEMVTKSTAKEAARRVRDARKLAAFPLVRDALAAGLIGCEHVEAIVLPLAKLRHVVPAAALTAAEAALLESSRTLGADLVSEQAKLWALRLDQDGAEPAYEQVIAKRHFTIGKVTDGLAKVSGLLPATHVAAVQSLLDAFVNPRRKVEFQDAEAEPLTPRDLRTAGQKRADALRDVFAAQARDDRTPELGGDHPTVWISTTEAELAAGRGLASLDGVAEPVPVSVAEQAACTGGVQEVIFDESGQTLRLGRTRRGFTHRQRRALTLRDGNGCIIPGCTTPARWCEVHHVTAHSRGGRTDVDNAVHLCWFHHHEIDTGPWRIRMVDGRPQTRWIYGSHASEWAWANPPTALPHRTT